MNEFIQNITNYLWLIPILIGIVAFLESLAIVGVIVPGVVILTALATASGQQDFSLVAILLGGFVGAWLGDTLSFFLGYKFKDNIINWRIFKNSQNLFARGHKFFADYGIISIVLGRFVGPIRPIIPILAGILAMNPIKFLIINSLSAIVWSPAYLLPGYLLGKGLKNFWLPPNSIYVLSYILAIFIGAAFGISYLRTLLGQDGKIYQKLDAKFSASKFWQRGKNSNPAREFPLAQYLLAIFSLTAGSLLFFLQDFSFSQLTTKFYAFVATNPAWMQIYTQLVQSLYSLPVFIGFTLIWLGVLVWQRKIGLAFSFLFGIVVAILAVFVCLEFSSGQFIDITLASYIILFGSIASFNAQFVISNKRHIYYFSALIILFLISLGSIFSASWTIVEIALTWLLSLFILAIFNLTFIYTANKFADFKPVKLKFLIINCLFLFGVIFVGFF